MATAHFRLLDLPPEIRDHIWNYALCLTPTKCELDDDCPAYDFDFSLLLVNRQVYYEARKIFRLNNIFVRIETPWQEAQNHVSAEGRVPIVAAGPKAETFQSVHMCVFIDPPHYPQPASDNCKFIVRLEDLPAFCAIWKYSDLSRPGLNRHLRLTLNLRDPYALEFETKPIPKALQQRLLLPFGLIKGLYEVNIQGEHHSSVEQALRDAMAVPYEPPEKCIADAERLKDAGNAALKENLYARAIQLYEQSFAAMHIICAGRRRSIFGEGFFDLVLRTGPYEGQMGRLVRTVLRVRLVANIVLAYLKLEDYKEARFWGMRSISIMRDANDGEDLPQMAFPAASEMGKIYFRTGLACKALEDRAEARKLFKVAAAYLPNDETVKMELASVALRIG